MFNDQVFNGLSTITVPVITPWVYTIYFGDFVIHNGTDIRISDLEYLKWKTTEVQKESFGNDGEVFNRRETLQTIKVSGTIKKTGRGDLLSFIDTFKSEISKENQYLIVTEDTWSRRVKCTCVDHSFWEKRYNIDWMPFELTFQTYKYWEESAVQETSIDTITQAVKTFAIARGGTAEARMTSIMSFTAVSWVTSITYEINWQSIVIGTTIAVNDSITIDWDNQRVLKNGLSIWFIGEIPKLTLTSNSIKITVNGTFSYNFVSQYHVTFK
jgi:phage-related protein